MASITLLSEAAAIGLHCCVLLAKTEEQLSSREIARSLDVSYDHTVQILQRLRRGGILYSTQGPQGGFRLRRPPEEITVLNVYEALEGPMEERRCLFLREKCDGDCVLFGELLCQVNSKVRNFFTQTTLKKLADKSCKCMSRSLSIQVVGIREGASPLP